MIKHIQFLAIVALFVPSLCLASVNVSEDDDLKFFSQHTAALLKVVQAGGTHFEVEGRGAYISRDAVHFFGGMNFQDVTLLTVEKVTQQYAIRNLSMSLRVFGRWLHHSLALKLIFQEGEFFEKKIVIEFFP